MAKRIKKFLSPLELHEKIHGDAAQPLVIDVRSHIEFDSGHIPEAVHMAGGAALQSIREIRGERAVVIYGDKRRPGSEQAAEELRSLGIQAQILDGGFPAWVIAKYPVVRGPQFHRIGSV